MSTRVILVLKLAQVNQLYENIPGVNFRGVHLNVERKGTLYA